MDIVGVSFDSPEKNQQWAMAEGFQYELWSDDPMRTLAVYYGSVSSPSAPAAGRVTRLIDANGDLLLEYNNVNLGIGTHPQKVLDDCEILFGGP